MPEGFESQIHITFHMVFMPTFTLRITTSTLKFLFFVRHDFVPPNELQPDLAVPRQKAMSGGNPPASRKNGQTATRVRVF
jgi:hypothetical protein